MSTLPPLTFDHYYQYDELTQILKGLAADFPQFATLHDIGKSHRGRSIWLLEIGNPATGSLSEKPGYFIDANIHAEEISGTSVVIYTAWTLLTQYGKDPLVTRLVDEQTFYLLPRLNPDGAEIVQTKPFYEWIGNGRYLPGEEQFGPGLHYQDINGDGMILDMRIRDDAGEWKVSDQDPRLMIPRRPDEFGGVYYRMVPEGMLVDWDGGDFEIPRPQDGNMNRNYPSNWVPEAQQYGAGEYALSEPEIAAEVRWILDHPNIAGIQSYHTHAGVILRPWLSFPDSHFVGQDKALFEMLGEMGVEETGYPLISVYEDFTPDKSLIRYGSFMEWSFGALGIPSLSTELWDVFQTAGIEHREHYPLRGLPEEHQLKLLRWQDEALGGEGFMPWTPFNHPQLGAVELGGWRRLYTFRNPPPQQYLEEMARRNCRFTLRHAAAAPRLRLRDVSAEAEGDGVYRISAVVDNAGFLPTNLSHQAILMKEARPVTVALSGPVHMRFIQGQPVVAIDHLAGRSGRPRAYSRFYDWPCSAKTVAWTVRLAPGESHEVQVAATSRQAGVAKATLCIGQDGEIAIEPPAVAGGRIRE